MCPATSWSRPAPICFLFHVCQIFWKHRAGWNHFSRPLQFWHFRALAQGIYYLWVPFQIPITQCDHSCLCYQPWLPSFFLVVPFACSWRADRCCRVIHRLDLATCFLVDSSSWAICYNSEIRYLRNACPFGCHESPFIFSDLHYVMAMSPWQPFGLIIHPCSLLHRWLRLVVHFALHIHLLLGHQSLGSFRNWHHDLLEQVFLQHLALGKDYNLLLHSFLLLTWVTHLIQHYTSTLLFQDCILCLQSLVCPSFWTISVYQKRNRHHNFLDFF